MSMQEFIEILDELIAVDTEEGLVKDTYADESTITVNMFDGKKFTVSVKEN